MAPCALWTLMLMLKYTIPHSKNSCMLISFSCIENKSSETNVYLDSIFIFWTLYYQQLHNVLLNAFTTCYTVYTVGNSRNKLHFFHFEGCVHIIFADKPTFYVIVHIRTNINLYHHKLVANIKKWNSIDIWLFRFI